MADYGLHGISMPWGFEFHRVYDYCSHRMDRIGTGVWASRAARELVKGELQNETSSAHQGACKCSLFQLRIFNQRVNVSYLIDQNHL